ncbi:MAG TPA: Ig-like domain-containing protein [Patescibacteria group bacterium]|nr:Ig-like domain-containing protein [Patescibacteria group bacterium]
MEQQIISKKYARWLVALVAAILLVWAGYFIYNSFTFRLTGTNPGVNNVATISPFFKINFNKNLSPRGLSVSASPDVIDSYSINGSAITVLLKTPLDSSQTYTLKVHGIASTGGKTLPGHSFSFKPRYLPSSQLPKDQQQALQNIQQQYNQTIQSDTLIQLLPFTSGGNEFNISYQVAYKSQKPIVTVTITAPSSQGQTDALAWIKSIGADPNKYTIQYVTGPVGY